MITNTTRIFAGVLWGLGLGMALGGLGIIAEARADVLRIGVAQAGGGDPVTFGGTALGVIRNQQLLEQAFEGSGTEVQWFFFKGAGPAVNEALSNRQIDFAYEGDLPQVVARANGLDTRLVAALGTRSPVYLAVPKGSEIRSVADLAGKRVAIFRGTNGHMVAINLLAAHGLSERDLRVINLDSGSTQAALASNGVDAAFGGLELFRLRDQGLVELIEDQRIGDPHFTRQTALLVRGEYADQHPEQVQKVVDVLVEAARWSSDAANRAAVLAEWSKSGAPLASWQAEYADQPLALRLSPLLDDFVESRYQAVADQALELRLIRRPVSIEGWFDTRFLERALRDQGLEHYWSRYDSAGERIEADGALAYEPD